NEPTFYRGRDPLSASFDGWTFAVRSQYNRPIQSCGRSLMENDGINRRKFLGTTAAVGLGALAHPSFSARVFGANDRIVMGIIGSGGRRRGVLQEFIHEVGESAEV